MDKKNKKTPRKTHNISTQIEEQIEEENLWALEDDADEAVSSDEPKEERAPEANDKPSVGEDPEETQTEQDPIVEDAEEITAGTSKIGALVEPLKKLSLSSTEKIALSAIAAIFIGLTIYGYIWLKGKNTDAVTADTLELPIEGKHATITEFFTFWKAPGNSPSIKLGAVIVPAASITLSEESKTGAFRVYFRNATQDSIGDPITISFQNGKFENGSNTIEVSASDGFHLKVDFQAYQINNSSAWKVDVLEAGSSSATSSGYKRLFHTTMAPTMR